MGRGSKITLVYAPPRRVYDAFGNVLITPDVPAIGAGTVITNLAAEQACGRRCPGHRPFSFGFSLPNFLGAVQTYAAFFSDFFKALILVSCFSTLF
ncbi:filamentous hemagglutinin family protein [Paenalcaligenes niemegkensis]|nr:filamentous hemagglutinin family protein [Paenalcaligenes niemegkensis]